MPPHQHLHAQILFSNSVSLILNQSNPHAEAFLEKNNHPRSYASFFRNAMQIDGLSFEKGLVALVGFAKGYKETPGEGQLFDT